MSVTKTIFSPHAQRAFDKAKLWGWKRAFVLKRARKAAKERGHEYVLESDMTTAFYYLSKRLKSKVR